jgi:hypothetical protein
VRGSYALASNKLWRMSRATPDLLRKARPTLLSRLPAVRISPLRLAEQRSNPTPEHRT